LCLIPYSLQAASSIVYEMTLIFREEENIYCLTYVNAAIKIKYMYLVEIQELVKLFVFFFQRAVLGCFLKIRHSVEVECLYAK